MIDGRRLQIQAEPVSINNYVRKQIWSKFTPWQLSGEDHIAFGQRASGYVLNKNNKLRVQSQLTEDTEILKNVHKNNTKSRH
jgi:hypothetical protein